LDLKDFRTLKPENPDYTRIVTKLGSFSIVEVNAAETQGSFTPEEHNWNGALVPAPDDRLYAVRGLAYGLSPVWTDVTFNPSLHAIHVHEATYNGENTFISYGMRNVSPCPIIVRLSSPPAKVYVSAELGGDAIIIHRPYKD